jgi:cytochrome c2
MADASSPKGNLTGEQVFQPVCKTCHEPGIAGAPKVATRLNGLSRSRRATRPSFSTPSMVFRNPASSCLPRAATLTSPM